MRTNCILLHSWKIHAKCLSSLVGFIFTKGLIILKHKLLQQKKHVFVYIFTTFLIFSKTNTAIAPVDFACFFVFWESEIKICNFLLLIKGTIEAMDNLSDKDCFYFLSREVWYYLSLKSTEVFNFWNRPSILLKVCSCWAW